MTNASLKEQLQALSLVSETTPGQKQPSRPSKSNQTNRPEKSEQKQQAKQKPVWLEHAQYGVELLKAHYPNCFKDIKEIQPLKVGIKQDLVKNLSSREDIVISDKSCMVSSLAYYVNSPSYHKNMVQGAMRIDLEGNPAGAVTVEEANYSTECRKAKLQKKKPTQAIPKPEQEKIS